MSCTPPLRRPTGILRVSALPTLALVIGCGPEAPAAPSWATDVRPILVANCVRCHGVPASGGAPDDFRLDVYDSTTTDGGDFVLGAGAMAEFIAIRVADESMPPRFPLSHRQRDTLEAWYGLAAVGMPPPLGEAADDDAEPTIRVLGELGAELDGGFAAIDYEVLDADGDLVTGELHAESDSDRFRLTRELRSGRGRAIWDVAQAPAADYELTATLDDGSGEVTRSLGTFAVTHPGGVSAPTVSFGTALQDALFSDADSPAIITVAIDDADPGDALILRVDAILGDTVIEVATIDDAARGDHDIQWNTADVPAGELWRLRAQVSDGSYEREVTSLPFIVGHGTTDLRYPDIAPLLAKNCTVCHPGPTSTSRVPGLGFALDDYAGVFAMRGPIYRRTVHEQTMPPESARLLFGDLIDIDDDDRARLREWLLAGAPQ